MKVFKTLKNDFIANRWRILIGLIALLIVDVLQLFIPRVIKYAIDDLTSPRFLRYARGVAQRYSALNPLARLLDELEGRPRKAAYTF